MAKCQGDAV